MHLLRNVNWKETTITFKNQRCIVGKGECVVNQRELASAIGISAPTVNRILKYFENINEIETRKTNAFTFISITYLAESKEHETPVKHQRNTKNVKSIKLKDLLTPIDNKDKKDNINNNKINFVVQKSNLLNQELNSPKKTKEINSKDDPAFNTKNNNSVQSNQTNELSGNGSKTDSVQKVNIVETLLDIWCEEYYLSRQFKYVVKKGKDIKGISDLLKFLKTEHSDLNLENTIEYFRNFCKEVLSIDESYYYHNCNPMFINNNINSVLSKIAETKKKKSFSSVGQAKGNGNYKLTFKDIK